MLHLESIHATVLKQHAYAGYYYFKEMVEIYL